MRFLKKAKRGFTLVELVVVIAVIAILAAVSVGAYFGVTESANKSKLEQEGKQFQTAIQTVALAGNSNHTLNADGLMVNDIDTFELALEESVGQDIEVLNEDPTYIAKQTLVLKTAELPSSENGSPTVYKTFEYYTAEISGKKIIVDVVTGDFAHATSDVVIDKGGADISKSTLYFQGEKGTHSYRAYLWAGEGDEKVENAQAPGVEINTYAKVLDIWAFKSSNIYTHVKFTYKNGDNTEDVTTEAIALPRIEANTPYYNNGTWGALPEIKNAATAGKTVYINEWNSAEKVYAYAFTFNLDKVNAVWPGVEMTRDNNRGDRLASYTFDQDYHTVVFNNGSGGEGNQTENLPLADVEFDNGKFFYNVTEERWDVIPEDVFVAPTSVGIKGTMTEWASEVAFTSSQDKKVWTLENYPLVAGTEFKLTVNGELTIDFDGLSEEDKAIFEREESHGNIKVKDAAYYSFTYNALNYTLDITKGETYEGEEVFVAPESISIIGKFRTYNWDHDVDFTSNDEGHTWEVKIELEIDNEFKIRTNHKWSVNGDQEWGSSAIDVGAEEYFEDSGTGNIKVKSSYIYNLKFNYDTKELSVTSVEPATHAIITLIGSRTGETWTDFNTMTTTDGENFTTTIDLSLGETFKLRKNGSWDNSWGTEALDSDNIDSLGGSGDILVEKTGTYTINFVLSTGKISNTMIPAKFTFKIVTTPLEAVVVFTVGETTTTAKTITVDAGTLVNYSVSCDGYKTKEGVKTINSDTIENIILVEESKPTITLSSSFEDYVILGQSDVNVSAISSDESAVKYYSSNPEIVSINENTGEITLKTRGTAKIYAKLASDETVISNEIAIEVKYRVYFENNWNWSAISVYAWGTKDKLNEWRNEKSMMIDSGKTNNIGYHIFYYDIPAGYENLIFSGIKGDGKIDQSPDIKNYPETVNLCYYMTNNNGNGVATYTLQ